MRLQSKKLIAVLCALAMIISVFPVQADAAAKPKFVKNYTVLYENSTGKGVYTYTVTNLTKGQRVKWSLSGTGKSYAKLKKTTTSVSGKTSANSLTIRTRGKAAAKNKTVIVTAKVYKGKKCVSTIKTKSAKIKILPKTISIVDNGVLKYQVGQTYQFQFRITPANAISTNVWTAVDGNGNDVSSMITKTGAFTPAKEGTYTITVQAKAGNKVVSDSKVITVATSMTGIAQMAANKVSAVYSGNAKNLVKTGDFSIRTQAGAKMEIKSAVFSDDGTQVFLTTYNQLKDGATYTVTDGQSTYDFTASVGRPVSLRVVTTEVTVGKETPIEYEILDANGIDVKTAYPGDITYTERITNGYRTKDNKIYMTRVGDTGTVTLTYKCASDPNLVLTGSGTFVCKAASVSNNTNLTLTSSEAVPNYSASSYKDNHNVASGSNYYVHFRALDTDNTEMKYDSIKFESSDPDTLLVNPGKNNVAYATAIKTGTANIIVTATYAKQEYTYVYEITVAEPAYLATLTADNTQITMSNAYAAGYKEYVNIDGRDQYGQSMKLENETYQIVENSTNKVSMATYDPATDRMVFDASGRAAGVYNYTLTLTMNGHKASVNVTVVVQTPPYNGASSYKVDISKPVIDLAITSGASASDLLASKVTTLRLAEYRGGVFYQYVNIASVRISKGGQYYESDLSKGGSSTEPAAIGSGSEIPISAVSLNGNVVTKAQTGTYLLELKFYPSDGQSTSLATTTGYLEVTDSQAHPVISVDRTVSTVNCKTALDLAKNCLSIQGMDGGVIADCTVTGSSVPGASYSVTSGMSVNINSVVVQATTTLSDKTTVVSNYTVSVGRTLRNQ